MQNRFGLIAIGLAIAVIFGLCGRYIGQLSSALDRESNYASDLRQYWDKCGATDDCALVEELKSTGQLKLTLIQDGKIACVDSYEPESGELRRSILDEKQRQFIDSWVPDCK